MRARSLAIVFVVFVVAPRTAAAATSFDVGASGMSAFVVDGVNNPTLTLTRGQTYTFNVNTFGHPFWITTARGADDAETNQFSQGVTGNGAFPGAPLTFVVPASAPATLFYQCRFHDPMGGTLNIISAAPSPPVPSLGPGALAALGALLLLVGASLARARRRSR
jgi:hypothetical protein